MTTGFVLSLVMAVGLAVAGWWTNSWLRHHNEELAVALARAERNVREAERVRARVIRHSYAGRLRLAQQELAAGHLRRAQELLAEDEPDADGLDHRDFAWFYLHRLAHRDASLLWGHEVEVKSLAVSPDGATLASGGADGSVIVWDLASRRPRAHLRGHAETVQSLLFSPDGALLASAGIEPGTPAEVFLWDMARYRLWTRLEVPSHIRMHIAFAPDGRTLATTGDDGVRRALVGPALEPV